MATTFKYVTQAGGGGSPNGGTTWADAYTSAEFLSDLAANGTSEYYYFVKPGTYTFGGDVTPVGAGTTQLPGKIIGVQAAVTNEDTDGATDILTSEWATLADRPDFVLQANTLTLKDWWLIYNLDFAGSDAVANVIMGSGGKAFNCKSVNSNAGDAFATPSANVQYLACEGVSTGGTAFDIASSDFTHAISCYVHDSLVGIDLDLYSAAVSCVIDTCTTGIDVGTHDGWSITYCSFYGCTTAIASNDGSGTIYANAFDFNTSHQTWTTQQNSNLAAYNIWDTTDQTNVEAPANWEYGRVDADPGFGGPAGGDFSITSSDNAADIANALNDLTGATV